MRAVEYDSAQLREAINTILRGVCKRVDINDDVKVYAVKDTIRIDMKVKEV